MDICGIHLCLSQGCQWLKLTSKYAEMIFFRFVCLQRSSIYLPALYLPSQCLTLFPFLPGWRHCRECCITTASHWLCDWRFYHLNLCESNIQSLLYLCMTSYNSSSSFVFKYSVVLDQKIKKVKIQIAHFHSLEYIWCHIGHKTWSLFYINILIYRL